MPIYEFRCQHCRKRFSELVSIHEVIPAAICPTCGQLSQEKLVSKFAHYRNEDDRIDSLADKLENFNEPDSASSMRELVKEMGKAMDDDCSDEMEELFESDMEGGDDSPTSADNFTAGGDI